MRLPLFVWTMEIYAALLIVVLPALSAGLTCSCSTVPAWTHFFIPSEGGDAVLYQHVFWFFGHPEVYIMILPAMGIVSEVIPVFARKPIFGYKAVAFSTVAIGFYSLLVWGHHMFTVGLPMGLQIWFMIASLTIAVPTGVKIFNWIATTWRGNLIFDTAMLWALGFIAVFTIGGLSGIYVAVFPFDWQVHDSYFVVAHLHYVLFGGSMFGVFAALYYWWPKMFGRMLNEKLGKWHFWLVFIGFNLTFFPQHMMGLLGMPRRIYNYRDTDLLGGVQPDLDGRLVHHGRRHPDIHRQRVLVAQGAGAAGAERPVAGGHARVVHDLAAAAAQLRQGPIRDEREAASRPAPANRRAALRAGPWLRLCGLGATAAVAAVVASGELGITHRALVLVALPLLVAMVLGAWFAHRRVFWSASGALVLFLAAVASWWLRRSTLRWPRWPRPRRRWRLRSSIAASAWRGCVARLRGAHEAADHVAATPDRRGGDVRRRAGTAGCGSLRSNARWPGAGVRRRERAEPRARPGHRPLDEADELPAGR